MIKKIKSFILIIVATTSFGIPALVPLTVSAACTPITNKVNDGINSATGGSEACTPGTGGIDLKPIATNIVNIFSIVVGVVAVIMIIYGGFRYITSGGESGNVSNAKNTLIYALVGLIIVALAQFIVHFVLNTAAGAT